MFTSLQFTALYNDYLESGLTVRDFCANHHMRESKFYYWKNRLKRQLPPKKGFVPVVFENQQVSPYHFSTPAQNQPKIFSNPAVANNPASCEISLPNGVSIKLSGMPDPEMLRTLLLLPHR
jgi:hypothetical protein